MADMKERIKALAARNRTATDEEKRRIEAEMKELEAANPKEFAAALESLIKETSAILFGHE